MEQLTDYIRSTMLHSGRSLKRISDETGIPYSVIHSFAHGGGLRSHTLDRLAVYLGLWDPGQPRWTGDRE